jgi:hypothetical protein
MLADATIVVGCAATVLCTGIWLTYLAGPIPLSRRIRVADRRAPLTKADRERVQH